MTRTGFLILLSIAMALAPAAPVFACADFEVIETVVSGAEPVVRVDPGAPSCCCGPSANACACMGCAEHAALSTGSGTSGGSEAKGGCACGTHTPRSNESAQTESIGHELRLAIGAAVARKGAEHQERLARSATVVRRDPHPQVRQPLLL